MPFDTPAPVDTKALARAAMPQATKISSSMMASDFKGKGKSLDAAKTDMALKLRRVRKNLDDQMEEKADVLSAHAAEKTAMPFLKQDRPKKVKEIYRALKRDHPEYSAQKKARIASAKGQDKVATKKRPEDNFKPKGKTALERFAQSRRGMVKKAMDRTGANRHIVDLAFQQELQKIATLGMALSGAGRAFMGGLKNLQGGLAMGARGAAGPAQGVMGQVGQQLAGGVRGAAQKVAPAMQQHLGIDAKAGLGQFNRQWAEGLTAAQKQNLAIGGAGAIGAAGLGAGAALGRATAPDQPQMRVTVRPRRVYV